jgi:hypothetical protein
MSAGIAQILAIGSQDAYITGTPQVSFFRSNYKQYSPFAHSVERQIINGNPLPGAMSSIMIERKGDLLSYMYLTATDNNTYSAINDLASNVITTGISTLSGTSGITSGNVTPGATTAVVLTSALSAAPVVGNYVVISASTNPALPNGTYSVSASTSTTSFSLNFLSTGLTSSGVATLTVSPVTSVASGGVLNNTTVPSASIIVNLSSAISATYLKGHIVYVTALAGSGNYAVSTVATPSGAALILVGNNFISGVSEIFLDGIIINNGSRTSFNFAAVQTTALPTNIQIRVAGFSPDAYNGLFTVVSSTIGSVTVALDSRNITNEYAYGTITRPSNKIQTIDWSQCIDKIEFYIGGQMIDMHDSTYDTLIDPLLMADTYSKRWNGNAAGTVNTSVNSYYPLKFFFCKDYQNALPLIGLQFNPIELRIYWAAGVNTSLQYESWAKYIYLNGPERDYFSNPSSSIDMFITQVQRQIIPSDYQMDIAFNHPVKFIAANVNPYVSGGQQIITRINNTDIGVYKGLPHFQEITQYFHTPYGLSNPGASSGDGTAAPILLIPYCLDTSKLQPTGTLNFSRIDVFTLKSLLGSNIPLQGGSGDNIFPAGTYLYAVNYNIFRIQNGQGALLFAN